MKIYKNYELLKEHMNTLIGNAQKVIAECEKETPDDILICDLAVEEMLELCTQIDMCVLGALSADTKYSACNRQIIVETQATHGLRECYNV